MVGRVSRKRRDGARRERPIRGFFRGPIDAMPPAPMFTLDPALDLAALADAYRRDGRVVIDHPLPAETALLLAAHLRQRGDWRKLVLSGERVAEFDRAGWAAIPADRAEALNLAVYAAARAGFQFRFDSIRLSDARRDRDADDSPLGDFARWMSSPSMLAALRTITGADDVRFADAQATAYAPGDFLTVHDDAVTGKHRRAAYVFGLTPQWRPEWGGLLLFHRKDGDLRAVAPGFNRLTLFAVPQDHSVSEVTRAAPARRYSITGWLRAEPQP
ncbi:2OG-Fe(II) oxygenase [Sphingomonas sp. Leaf4]|uniref:2OG-Fe(II) oxygenase n=1 Tax=Sphingomonas sp. Leaf4 TaxID=2876553 RepID=UPI001E467BCB|nr:2OG-Fe(II) oxygenase family protein [Sphingomonas sp. Leaf4]